MCIRDRITASFSHKFKEEISEWGREDMPETWTTALTLIALHVEMNIPWDPRSDLSCARVLGALFTDKFRAHKGSVAQYKEGAWRPVEELDERTLRLL
eukprot:3625168-Pyramimonas_sp.AAC.1